METQSPVEILVTATRGYATDDQRENALKREEELISALSSSYEAMLQMRAMLSKHADVSLMGGPIQATIEATATILYPPSTK